MTEEKKAAVKASDAAAKTQRDGLVAVKLVAAHTHQGQPCQPGDSIRVRPQQVQKLREWGVVR